MLSCCRVHVVSWLRRCSEMNAIEVPDGVYAHVSPLPVPTCITTPVNFPRPPCLRDIESFTFVTIPASSCRKNADCVAVSLRSFASDACSDAQPANGNACPGYIENHTSQLEERNMQVVRRSGADSGENRITDASTTFQRPTNGCILRLQKENASAS